MVSSQEWEVCTCHSLGNPQKSFCQILAFTQPVSELLPARQHSTPVIYLRHGAAFHNCKLQILGTHTFAIYQFVQEKWSVACLHSGSEFMAKLSTNPAPRFPAFNWCHVLMLGNMVAHWHCQFFLSPKRQAHHSQIHSKQGNCFFLCNPGVLQTMLPSPGSPPSSPTETPVS